MKKLLVALILLSGVAFAANTHTTRVGIPKPADGDTGWGTTIRSAFDIIDSSFSVLSATETHTGGVTVTSGTITTLRTSQILISSTSYPGTEVLVVQGAVKLFSPTGAVVSFCDSNGTNCTNLSIDNSAPSTGVEASTISVRVLGTKATNQSVFVGNSVGTVYVGTATARPSTALGTFALSNFIGTYSDGSVGGGNTAVGYSGLSSLVRGKQNLSAGDSAGAYLTDGSYNTFLGYGAGSGAGGDTSVVISTDSIFIGQYTGGSSSFPVTNAVAIGAYAKVNSSHSFVIGPYVGISEGYGQSLNVGIGTDTPKAALHVIHDSGKTSDSYSMIVSSSGASSDVYSFAVSTSGAVGLVPLTATQIKAVVPRRVGQYFYCSDCSTVSTCVSTGTLVNQWALITAKTSACQ